ncbi:glucose-1-phosphate thymidylyltransferase [Patescibacteria group bacterium]|nr:glucose-1-phosphate thymidylyltransferase [Patescibacteria group bacterium]
MKALLTAGGRATRLRPITWTINKHLIPLANKPMLAHAIEKLVDAGITEIGINVNVGEREIQAAFGDGSKFGARITYLEQAGGPLGLAHIIKNAKGFLGNEPFLFYLGDNIILGSLRRFVERFESGKMDALLALSRVKDPQRFGVPVLENGRITKVIEKPEVPPSDFAVTGIYLYSTRVFDAVEAIQPSPRGEYEISDVHSWLIDAGAVVGYEEITGWWKDTGTPTDLLEGNSLLLNERPHWQIRIDGMVEEGAVLRGEVSVGKGTIIGKDVVIRGPVAIGENCVLKSCYVGPYTSVGDGTIIDGADVEQSLIFAGATIRGACRLANALIGKNALIEKMPSALPRGHELIVGDNARVQL